MTAPDRTHEVVILNPVSGDGNHTDAVRDQAANRGYEVRETREAGDGIELAREAAEHGATTIAAAGGDGTLNEVVRGVASAGALDRVTVGVIPVGTGNNFAGNIGITDIEAAFSALEEGDRRQIDLGRADDRPFVNSCVGGLTADASGQTTSEMKSRFGVLAYVVSTLRAATEFEGIHLSVDVPENGDRTVAWEGEAICVLIGNGRRFSPEGSEQANVEDGLLDVVIVEDVSTIDLMEETVIERLLGRDASYTTRLQAPALNVDVAGHEAVDFSLDGEMISRSSLSLRVEPGALRIPVGEAYEPDPDV